MQILIKFNGKFCCFLSPNKSMMAKISSKTGLNLRCIKIKKEGNLINFDKVGLVVGENSVFDILIKRELIHIEAKLPNENIIYVSLSELRKIIDIKSYIEKKTNIPFNKILLEYNDVNLRDDTSLAECFGEVKKPKIIVIKICDISVNVTCHKRGYKYETLTLRIRTNDTVRRLKEIINDKCSFDIPPNYQELCYRTKMRDENTVRTYNIEDGSQLTASFVKSIIIFITCKDGSFVLLMDWYDTVCMVKDNLKIKLGIDNGDNIELYFCGDELKNERILKDYGIDDGDTLMCLKRVTEDAGYSDRRITMRIEEGDTFIICAMSWFIMKDLREIMERRYGYEWDRHELMVDGELLDDDDAITMPYINKIIDIVPYKSDISVNVTCHKRGYKDETLTLRIWTKDTVRRLKEIINDKCSFDIPPNNQELCYHTKMRDEYTVGTYNIEDGSQLTASFVKSIDICIDCKGRRYNLTMDWYDTVHMVKEKLRIENGIKKIDDIELLFRGDELENERTLMDYDIDDGDTLTCLERIKCGGGYSDCRITMQKANGDRFIIDTAGNSKMKDVREMIERRYGYRRNRYELLVDGELWDDDNAYAGFYDNKIIDIVPYKRVQFQIIDNDVFTDLDIDDNMFVADIKKLIFKDIGLIEGIQQLYLDGTLLNDKDTVKSSPLAQGTKTKRIECKLLIADEV